MSAETFGSHLPAIITLDDLAAMNAADRFGHRYELSPAPRFRNTPPLVFLDTGWSSGMPRRP
ncbi:hypothetical protein [Actinoplanes subtropicus]|uniref:hypothetical protein n=1 Tax=Actinoplanes subtropicus TaxID=543632 RepID=UPI001FE19E1A|nr:hypothetical protein [Actinoplanes subtropicus]